MKRALLWIGIAIVGMAVVLLPRGSVQLVGLYQDLWHDGKVEWTGKRVQIPKGRFTWSTAADGTLMIRDRYAPQNWLTLSGRADAEQLVKQVSRDVCGSRNCEDFAESVKSNGSCTVYEVRFRERRNGDASRWQVYYGSLKVSTLIEISAFQSEVSSLDALADSVLTQLCLMS